MRERFQRDARVSLEIERLINDTHAAVTELTLDHVSFAVGEYLGGFDLHLRRTQIASGATILLQPLCVDQ